MRRALLAVVLLVAGCGAEPAPPPAAAPPTTVATTSPTTISLERIDPPSRAVAPNGDVLGHWDWQGRSPDGATLLGAWSGECESPSAWFADGEGPWRPVIAGPGGWPLESEAHGWSDDGRAEVYFTEGLCGSGIERPGTYLVTPQGEATFVSPDRPTD